MFSTFHPTFHIQCFFFSDLLCVQGDQTEQTASFDATMSSGLLFVFLMENISKKSADRKNRSGYSFPYFVPIFPKFWESRMYVRVPISSYLFLKSDSLSQIWVWGEFPLFLSHIGVEMTFVSLNKERKY